MSWGTHPDAMTMSMASTQAIEATGESDSLTYFEVYRNAYEQMAAGQNGVEQYLRKLDKEIAGWKEYGRDIYLNYDAPMMSFILPEENKNPELHDQKNNPFAHGNKRIFRRLIRTLFTN